MYRPPFFRMHTRSVWLRSQRMIERPNPNLAIQGDGEIMRPMRVDRLFPIVFKGTDENRKNPHVAEKIVPASPFGDALEW